MGHSHASADDGRAGAVLEELLERFESAWRAGTPPRIDTFLSDAAGPVSDPNALDALLEELIKVDLEYRWRSASGSSGSTSIDPGGLPPCPRLEDYAARLTALATPDGLRVSLIAEEYRVRRRWGDRPSQAEYLARFPERGDSLAAELAAVDAELAAESPTEHPHPHHADRVALPGVCPQCHSPLDPSEQAGPEPFVCPACRAAIVGRVTYPLSGSDAVSGGQDAAPPLAVMVCV